MNNLLRDTEAFRDDKRITLPSFPNTQAIQGLQRFRVKLHSSVFETRRRSRESLDLVEVGRRDDGRTGRVEPLEQRDGQTDAFAGIGPGREFIQQQQRFRPGPPQNVVHIGHMSRKSAECALNALSVANIDEYVFEHAQFAARATSRASANRTSTNSSCCDATSSGSMYTVWPLADSSSIAPLTIRLLSRLMGKTGRPFRIL